MEDYPSLPTGNCLVWTDRRPFNAECKESHLKVDLILEDVKNSLNMR